MFSGRPFGSSGRSISALSSSHRRRRRSGALSVLA
jgi:hypothetical protein